MATTTEAKDADYSAELSRPFRGLRVWIPLMLHGVAAFREALAERMELAHLAYSGLRKLELDVSSPPSLSAFGFRLPRARRESLDDWNGRNRSLLERINARGRVLLSSTMLPVSDGQAFTLRVCVVSFRTTAADITHLIEDTRQAMAECEPSPRPG